MVRITAGLDEIYCRSVLTVPIKRRRRCASCNGRGGVGRDEACQRCQGSGRIKRIVPVVMGLGLAHEISEPCTDCSGTGRVYSRHNVCRTCHGARIVTESKTFHVRLGETRYVFPGEGDEEAATGFLAGDLKVYVSQRDHAGFARREHDLVTKRSVTLSQALRGFVARIEHLDGRSIWIRAGPGDVSPSSALKRVPGEGMRRGGVGSLYIVFTVDFPVPGTLTDAALNSIATGLRGARYKRDPGNIQLFEASSSSDSESEPLPTDTAVRDLHGTDSHDDNYGDDGDDDNYGDDGEAVPPGCTTS